MNRVVLVRNFCGRHDQLFRANELRQVGICILPPVYKLLRAGASLFQRSLFDQQDQLAEREGFVVQHLLAIYKAVGGGWAEDGTRTETFTLGAAAAETP